jgi:hypothetical protein
MLTRYSYLAATEMAYITFDAWDEEIWGAAKPSPSGIPRAKIRFLFADKDHWVADQTREYLIRRRGVLDDGNASEGAKDWKPRMEIQNGLSHSFCIHQSEMVAEKVAKYVSEVVEADEWDTL